MRTEMRTPAAPGRAHHAGFQSTRHPQATAAQLCGTRRSAGTLPQLKGALAKDAGMLSNAALFELLDA
jgi:hypothetical protein